MMHQHMIPYTDEIMQQHTCNVMGLMQARGVITETEPEKMADQATAVFAMHGMMN
jgi:hypothetical protein